MNFLKQSNGEVVLACESNDANDPRVWDLYKFVPIPSVYDAPPLDLKEKIMYLVVMGLATVIYFCLCFLI